MLRHKLFTTLTALTLSTMPAWSAPAASESSIQNTFRTTSEQLSNLADVLTRLNSSPLITQADRQRFVTLSLERDRLADAITDTLTRDLLQRQISESDPRAGAKLASIHRMVATIQKIKETSDMSAYNALKNETIAFRQIDNMAVSANGASDANLCPACQAAVQARDAYLSGRATTVNSGGFKANQAPVVTAASAPIQTQAPAVTPRVTALAPPVADATEAPTMEPAVEAAPVRARAEPRTASEAAPARTSLDNELQGFVEIEGDSEELSNTPAKAQEESPSMQRARARAKAIARARAHARARARIMARAQSQAGATVEEQEDAASVEQTEGTAEPATQSAND